MVTNYSIISKYTNYLIYKFLIYKKMSLGGCEICDILRNEHDKVNGRTLRTFLIDDLDLASSKKHILVFPLEHVESIDELSSQ